MKQDKIEQAILECYTELFANATPYADFNKLMEEASVNEFGQKEIPFMGYEIEEDIAENIIADIIKTYKLRHWTKKAFRTTILLGCSPKFKKNEAN